jgi:hypothetical protein
VGRLVPLTETLLWRNPNNRGLSGNNSKENIGRRFELDALLLQVELSVRDNVLRCRVWHFFRGRSVRGIDRVVYRRGAYTKVLY